MKFFAKILTAFFWRQKPVSNIPKPAFTKITKTEATKIQIESKTPLIYSGVNSWAGTAATPAHKAIIRNTRGMQANLVGENYLFRRSRLINAFGSRKRLYLVGNNPFFLVLSLLNFSLDVICIN